jgi:hypothetical protein
MNLIDQVVPVEARGSYSYDVLSYNVGRQHDYPRFLCYDCHAYASYTFWNPYDRACDAFQMVIYDAPQYYPSRAYDGTRVIYSRPLRLDARFAFEERMADDRDPLAMFVHRADTGDRRVASGAAARDLMGVGSVAPPIERLAEDDPRAEGADLGRYRRPVGVDPRLQLAPRGLRPGGVVRLQPRLERRVPAGSTRSRARKPTVRPTVPPAQKPDAKSSTERTP